MDGGELIWGKQIVQKRGGDLVLGRKCYQKHHQDVLKIYFGEFHRLPRIKLDILAVRRPMDANCQSFPQSLDVATSMVS